MTLRSPAEPAFDISTIFHKKYDKLQPGCQAVMRFAGLWNHGSCASPHDFSPIL